MVASKSEVEEPGRERYLRDREEERAGAVFAGVSMELMAEGTIRKVKRA